MAVAAPLAIPMAAFLLLNALAQWPALVAQLGSLSRLRPADTSALFFLALCCGSGVVGVLGALWPWMDGALTYLAIERLHGRDTGARAAWRATRPQWGSLWAVNAVRVVAMGFAWLIAVGPIAIIAVAVMGRSGGAGAALAVALLALFCLPVTLVGVAAGAGLGTIWSVSFPAAVSESADGFAALGRSHILVRGSRSRMFGRSLGLLLFWTLLNAPLVIVQALAVLGAIGARGASGPATVMFAVYAVAALIGAVLFVIGRPVNAIFYAVCYLDLRERATARGGQAQPLVLTAPAIAAGPKASPVVADDKRPPSPPATFSIPLQTPVPLPLMRVPPLDANATPAQRVGHYFNRLLAEGDRSDILNELGLAYMDVGDLSAATDALDRARALAPADADIAYNLMRASLARGDTSGARRMMAEYLRLETNPDDRAATLADPRFSSLV